MKAAALIEQMLAQRRRTLDLPGGLRVVVVRPAEAEVGEFLQAPRLAAAQRYVVGWEGFTEATFLGAGVGGSDPVPFDQALWGQYIADHADLVEPILNRLLELVKERHEARDLAAKN